MTLSRVEHLDAPAVAVRGATVASARALPGPIGLVLAYQVVGVALLVAECAMRAVTHPELLRDTSKHSFTVLLATGTLLGVGAALLALLRRTLRVPASPFYGLLLALAAYALGSNLFSGVWVSRQWFAPYGPAVLGLVALAAGWLGSSLSRSARTRPDWVWSAALGALGVALATADVLVLPRLYPMFHLSLVIGGWVALAHALIASPWRPRFWVGTGRRRAIAILALAVSLPAVWWKPPSPLRRLQWDLAPGYASRVYEQVHLAWWRFEALHVVTRFAPAIKVWLRHDSRLSELHQPQAMEVWRAIAAHRQRSAFASSRDGLRPHVIVITVDALRADVAALGPHWSALAARGLSFTHAYAPASSTQRSLPALVTGRYDWHDQDGSVIERLNAAGYTTAFVSDRVAVGHLRYREQIWLSRVRSVAAVDGVAQRPTSPGVVERASALLRDRPAGSPIFAWVHFFDLHEWAHLSRGAGSAREHYERVWRAQDAAVGALVDAAEAALRDRPIVFVLTSDHGEYLGEAGRTYHTHWVDLPVTHVPLVVIAPGHAPQVLQRPVGLFDVAPTLAEVTGVADLEHEGVSLLRPDASVDAARPLILGDTSEIAIVRGSRRLLFSPLLSRLDLFDDSNIAAPRAIPLEQFPGYERELLMPLLGSPMASAAGSPLSDL